MNATLLRISLAVGLAAGLTACGQEAAKTSAGPTADQTAAAAADNGYVEKTFTSGDQASWNKALKDRAAAQNDYVRAKPL
jgi:propanediol dehydratase large subunit